MSSVPDVSIEITPASANQLEISFQSPRASTVTIDFVPGNNQELVDEVSARLLAFKQLVGGTVELDDFGRVSRAMDELCRMGNSLFNSVFPGTAGDEISTFFKRAIPSWHRHRLYDLTPPLVEVRGQLRNLIPFELFPMFDQSMPRQIEKLIELEACAARFLGFTAVVYRLLPEQLRGNRADKYMNARLGTSKTLRVRFFQHAGLAGALRERDNLAHSGTAISLVDVWPTMDVDQNNFPTQFLALVKSGGVVNQSGSFEGDHIQHFSCHCDTTPNSSFDHTIILAHRRDERSQNRRSDRRVTIRQITELMRDSPSRRSDINDPLVVFNACGSSFIKPWGVFSFPELFLIHMSDRGFIGTATNVPDEFAAQFTGFFYQALRDKCGVGAALYRTRWALLGAKRNPLGILYMLYANPDLRLGSIQGL